MTTELFGADYERPQQKDCSDCACCTAALCGRGRNSLMECAGHTPPELREIVLECPCSASTTTGTASWRAAQVRVTHMAREGLLPGDAEMMLRALADGRDVDDSTLLSQLTVRGLARLVEERPVITELGRTFLAALDDVRAETPVHVLEVDKKARTARVEVAAWRPEEPVTVLLDQVVADSGLDSDALAGRWLAAEANCHAESRDRLVLTAFRDAPEMPESWMPAGAA